MKAGQISETGPVDGEFAKPAHRYAATLLDVLPLFAGTTTTLAVSRDPQANRPDDVAGAIDNRR